MEKISKHTVASVLQNRASVFLSTRHNCLRHDDVDSIHDLRVATRRLRAVVQLYSTFCKTDDITSVYSVIKSVTREIGVLRNIDEALFFINNRCLVDSEHDTLFELPLHRLNALRRHEAEKVRRMLKKLDAAHIQKTLKHIAMYLPESLGCTCDVGQDRYIISHLSAYNLKLFGQVQDLIGLALDPDAVKYRHALRISIKKWRYFLEILAELTEKDYSGVLTNLKSYQSILGSLNDLSVFCDLLNGIGLTDAELIRFKYVSETTSSELLDGFILLLNKKPIRYEFLL